MISNKLKISNIERVYFKLISDGNYVFDIKDVMKYKYNYLSSKQIIRNMYRKGFIFKIARGRYCLNEPKRIGIGDSYLDPKVIASQIFKDYYFSYLSAWEIHGLSTHVPFRIYIAAKKQYKKIKMGDINISIVKLTPKKFYGVISKNYKDITIKVSDLEKTTVDSFDKPHLVGGIEQLIEILDNLFSKKRINFKKLLGYIKNAPNIVHRLGFLFEKYKENWEVPDNFLFSLGKKVKKGRYYLLEPKSKYLGKRNKKWSIIINVKGISNDD